MNGDGWMLLGGMGKPICDILYDVRIIKYSLAVSLGCVVGSASPSKYTSHAMQERSGVEATCSRGMCNECGEMAAELRAAQRSSLSSHFALSPCSVLHGATLPSYPPSFPSTMPSTYTAVPLRSPHT